MGAKKLNAKKNTGLGGVATKYINSGGACGERMVLIYIVCACLQNLQCFLVKVNNSVIT